jgi:DNA polymerase elongation subunit (family B)
MTQGSNALFDYKNTVTEKAFNAWFPTPSYDADVRQSYKGGFTYLNPLYVDKDVETVVVFDVNSLYPSVMRNKLLPFGEGIWFEGQYQKDDLYPLYVQMFKCNFELKKHKIPTVQIKKSLSFVDTEYLTSSNGEDPVLCMTNVDYELFREHYDVYNLEFISGWKFKATTGLFTKYIDKWSEVKIKAKHEGNKAMYLLAKLMLNALYGKFALNPNVQSKYPVYENGIIKFKLGEKETREPLYIPVGTFITAWARHTTIKAAQSVFHRFIYADTDSLHLRGEEIPDVLEVDDAELGKWKHEGTFVRARFLRQKSYIEEYEISIDEFFDKVMKKDGNISIRKNKCFHLKVTCAGMPEGCYSHVTWDNFHPGSSYPGKLQQTSVKGGIILQNIDFTIKKC